MAKVWSDHETAGIRAAEAHAAAAIERARRGGQPWCEARLQLARCAVHSIDGRLAQAVAAVQAALPLLESGGETALLASALNDLSGVYLGERDNPRSVQLAIETGLASLKHLDPRHQRFIAAQVHHNLSTAYFVAKRLPEAADHALRAKSHAQRIGDHLGGAFVGSLQAGIALAQRRPAAALALFTEAKARFAEAGVDYMQLSASLGRARALLELQRVHEARSEIAASEALRSRIDKPASSAEFHEDAIDVHATAGDVAAATAAAKAYAGALRDREREENLRAAAELRERFEGERTETENRLLREQQQSALARQRWLLASLVIGALLLVGLVLNIWQQRRLRQRLKILAEVDELSGLPNRRSILAAARALAAGHRAADHPACVALIDIDHFKRVNDHYGHEAGDAALVVFAQACRNALRTDDVVGRLGGEEFLMVLPNTRPEDASAVFERLRDILRETQVPGLPAEERLACSMGCALLEIGGAVEKTLRCADEALYRAKAEGRDRLALAAQDQSRQPEATTDAQHHRQGVPD